MSDKPAGASAACERACAAYMQAFSTFLRTGEIRPLEPYLAPEHAEEARARAFIYRNNVYTALKKALARNFCVLHAMVGEDFFITMAHAFLEKHHPRVRYLSGWGEELPAWLEAYSPVENYPYLPDIARLDWAFLRASLAAGAGMRYEEMAATENPQSLRLDLVPSACIVALHWDVFALWDAVKAGKPPVRPVALEEESTLALFWRSQGQVRAIAADATDLVLLRSIEEGEMLEQAVNAAMGHKPTYPAEERLGVFLAGGLFCARGAECFVPKESSKGRC